MRGGVFLAVAMILAAAEARAQTMTATPPPASTPATTAASAPASTPPPPQATPANSAARSDLTVSPSALILDSSRDTADRDMTLRWKIAPTDPLDPVTIAVSSDPPDGLSLSAKTIGAADIERDAKGDPTGMVVQRVRLHFAQIPRRLDVVPILLTAQLGRRTQVIEVSATNLSGAPSGASLTVQGPGELRWDGSPIALAVSTSGAPAPGLSFSGGPFIGQASKRDAGLDLCLAETRDGDCVPTIDLGENMTQTLFVRPRSSSGGPTPGSYGGSLHFLAANSLKADIPLTLDVNSPGARLLGLVALVVGTVLSFVLTVYLPYQRERDTAFRPFEALHQRLLVAKRRRGKSQTPRINELSHEVEKELTLKWLVAHGKLGGNLPAASGEKWDAAALQTYLETETAMVEAIEKMSNAIVNVPDGAGRIDALVRLPFPPPDLDAALSAITGVGARMVAPPAASPSLGKLVQRESTRNFVFWLVSAILTVLVGYVLLIDSNPNFGSASDFATALLWTLGLSTAGGKLGDVTTAKIRTVLLPAPVS